MSGILGLWRLDGAPVRKGELNDMASPMRRRGPEGVHIWRDGPVGLGHTLLATTPEAALEPLPLIHEESGVTITADARLDNRDSLFEKLDLAEERTAIGDGELILQSYLKWGNKCLEHLLGDFAFVIWDNRKQEIFCARDHLGLKQILYLHSENRFFACATDHEAILALPDVPRTINQARILDCLTDHLESVDKTSTMFLNIYRLPPGHRLTVSRLGLRIEQYWQLQPPEELQLASDLDYEEAFKQVFNEAVRARLRGGEIVGSMMSGGLDSSSIVAAARAIRGTQSFGPLSTLSAIGDEDHPDNGAETRSIRSMTQLEGIRPLLVSLDDMKKLAPAIYGSMCRMGEPFDGSMNLIRAIYHTAHVNGLKVVLDGVGGDVAMETGHYGKRLIRQGKLFKAWDYMKTENSFLGSAGSDWEAYLRMLASSFLPQSLRERRGKNHSRQLYRELIEEAGIRKDFADKHHLFERLEMFRCNGSRSTWKNAQRQSVRMNDHPNEIVARERYDRVAAEYGIETRDPYRDIRMVNFCMSLPSAQKNKGGWTKSIVRRAFSDQFPEPIKNRMGKEDLGGEFTEKVADYTKETPGPCRTVLSTDLRSYRSDVNELKMFEDENLFLSIWLSGQPS